LPLLSLLSLSALAVVKRLLRSSSALTFRLLLTFAKLDRNLT
jgi:hypothetical protein